MHAVHSAGGDPTWVGAMRRGDHLLAWALSDHVLAQRDPGTRDDPSLPYHLRWVWDGTPVDGRAVLVRCYHGLGDTLQFARFLPELKRRAASVTVEAQPALVELLQGFGCRVVPFDVARPLPPAECDVEIMELSFALRAAPGDHAEPWLSADGFRLPAGTVGLCLTAGDWDRDRCVPAELFAAEPLRRPCLALDLGRSPLGVLNPGGCPQDMAATVALLAGCAVVVTVDTMIAHLAGAMGKPAILMLKHAPDWRWTPERGRSEWYPGTRLLAQFTPGDWVPVVANVREELAL